jgi:hypothetical protein
MMRINKHNLPERTERSHPSSIRVFSSLHSVISTSPSIFSVVCCEALNREVIVICIIDVVCKACFLRLNQRSQLRHQFSLQSVKLHIDREIIIIIIISIVDIACGIAY